MKTGVVKIDFAVWTTQAQYCKDNKVKASALSMRIQRGKIEVWEIKQLGIILVSKCG